MAILRRGPSEKRPASTHERAEVPVTVLARREILETIAVASGAAGERETGGPLIGTMQSSWEDGGRLIVSVLGTVCPGPTVDGRLGSVGLGSGADGERAASALRWWRAVTDLDLRHLGDWHRHPSGSPLPSSGDHRTAAELRAESSGPVWLVAITVGERRGRAEVAADDHAVRFSSRLAGTAETRFYRESGRLGLVPTSVRVEDGALPALPLLPWHVTDPARFAAECRLLRAAGLTVEVGAHTLKGRPGLALRLGEKGGGPSLTVLTGPRYPREAPVVLDARGRPLTFRWDWSPTRFLVDAIKEVS